ncbi:unnamed protein product [Nippostrongylus brasiliensis]|uniref:Uncharacterized serine carboxypeptidase F13S12.6 (inferred by orthology to a C. elegans protein) n=1 Tax=Nippostrongylus brasiliensis TaxID=27835 RepID=A0A0N4YAQ1_NIPBR|nr:unnamed protein product [Nippostrongylus brasiliensis]
MAALSSSLLLLLIGVGIQAAQIINLPGAPPVNFKQYSGYYTVGTTKNHQLHYWFVESQNNPATDPVLLWLTGGPGCSGLSALLTEWGPFMVNADGATLSANPYSWNLNASILTLEAPAGVGYSYATNGVVKTGDDQVFFTQWQFMKLFSLLGIYVPTLVQTILDRQTQYKINIKGFAVGNGCVSSNEGTDSLINFQYAHGMIDDTKWQKIKSQCCHNDTDDCPFHQFNGVDTCSLFVETTSMNAWNGGINPYNMYDNCVNTPGTEVSTRFRLEYKYRTGKELDVSQLSTVPCMNETAVTVYLNRPDVRKALGIPTSLGPWAISMVYSGDVDMACNFLMGQRFSRKLGLKEIAAKKHYIVDGQIGGFHTQYDGLHFVTVRGAGHMVPTDKPSVAYHIINAFLFDQKF